MIPRPRNHVVPPHSAMGSKNQVTRIENSGRAFQQSHQRFGAQWEWSAVTNETRELDLLSYGFPS